MGERRSKHLVWLAAGLLGLIAFSPAASFAQEEENPFAEDEDPFAEEDESETGQTTQESGEAIPPPTVPEGYDSQPPPQQPVPQAGYGQPAQGQPGAYPAPARTRPPRLQRIPYREGMEIPEGGRLVEKRRTGLLIAGAAMFGVSYALSVSLYVDIIDFSAWMAVPLIGPFVETGNDFLDGGGRLLLVMDGLVQTAGMTLFILGLAKKKRFIEYYARNEPGWRLTPRFGPSGGGLDLHARF